MNGAFITLTADEQENILRAIETSLQVKKRYQFFLWTQGQLQALLPHDVLICLVMRDGEEMLMMDRFNSCVVSEETFDEVCHPVDGLVTRAMLAWREAGDSPCLIAPDMQIPAALYDRFSPLLERACFGNAAAHGSAPIDGSGISSSFFFFGGMPGNLSLRHAYFLELLMPHIHMAFLRTLAQAERSAICADGSMRLVDLRKLMTEREIEILGWVQEGKSNQDIGEILNISPLTVKNHVQKILRKLNVRNRAQAVSKATAMRLIVGYAGAV
jgi:transcriptional regulator EpsA